ncbi:hypothetical protein DW103_13010 [Parabacteroides sp. AM08-6]|nr:hypothetical protein DW103_13010 [Parabacteroides sp. AM08-6]
MYSLCYLIDKKAYTDRKKIEEKNCRFKTYAYFCDEKKRTFFLVILLSLYTRLIFNYLHSIHYPFSPLNNRYARTLLVIYYSLYINKLHFRIFAQKQANEEKGRFLC